MTPSSAATNPSAARDALQPRIRAPPMTGKLIVGLIFIDPHGLQGSVRRLAVNIASKVSGAARLVTSTRSSKP